MNVALCDDDKCFLDELEQQLSIYDCSVYIFHTSEALIASNVDFDIAFLDIELGDNNTIFDDIRLFKMKNKDCIISFFTNYNQYAIKGYEYQAFRYILKNEPKPLINARIDDVFKEYYRKHKTISGSYNGYAFSVELDDVYYISVSNHIITLHTAKGDFEVYKKMKDINNELKEMGFLRCHRSYMVNISHILVMRSDYVFVLNDPVHTTVPIGIRYKAVAESEYINGMKIGGR